MTVCMLRLPSPNIFPCSRRRRAMSTLPIMHLVSSSSPSPMCLGQTRAGIPPKRVHHEHKPPRIMTHLDWTAHYDPAARNMNRLIDEAAQKLAGARKRYTARYDAAKRANHGYVSSAAREGFEAREGIYRRNEKRLQAIRTDVGILRSEAHAARRRRRGVRPRDVRSITAQRDIDVMNLMECHKYLQGLCRRVRKRAGQI